MLQLQSSSDALPCVIQSSLFQRASSIITSGFAFGDFSTCSVVFRALPVLNPSSRPSTSSPDYRLPAIVSSSDIQYQHIPHSSSLAALDVSVTAVPVASGHLSSRSFFRFHGPCFQSSLKRSLRRQWLGMPVRIGTFVYAAFASEVILFRVDELKTDDFNSSQDQCVPTFAVVGSSTSINVNLACLESFNPAPAVCVASAASVNLDNVSKLRNFILRAVDPQIHSGHIVAVCGVHGSGKSTLCKQVASCLGMHTEIISLSSYVSPPCGSHASTWTPQIGLRVFNSVLSAVLSKRPSTLVIDDFFLFDPSSPTASAILNSIQKLSGQRVCAVLCCRQSSSIPPEIRSPTQLLGVIEIGALTEQQRYDVFRECARSSGCVLDDIVDWRDIMKYCSGYTIGDMRRLFASYLSHSSHTTSFDVHHFLDAVKSNSSACSDIPLEFPTDRLDSLAGFCEIRDRLEQLIVRPVLCPMQYQAMGMCIPKGLLICGPKGSGKTSFVRAAAGSAGAALITVTPSLLYRRYLGESEAAVKSIYATARSRSPCVVFLDDTDALLASRNSDASDSVGERVLAALLTEIDGLEGSNNDLVLTVGATSRSDAIDPALARPGRLETCLHLHLPSFDDRLQILASLLKRMNVHTAVDLQSLTLLTEGMAVESLLSLCHRAAHSCMENGTSNTIVPADFSRALEKLNMETRK